MATKEPLLPTEANAGSEVSLKEIALDFLTLGATAFGGPPIHIGMFQNLFVERKQWLSSTRFAELFAMANTLPGPSSTQVAFALGMHRAGVIGGIISGGTFIIPGAIALTLLGFAASYLTDQIEEPASAANSVAIACSAVGVALIFVAIVGLVKKQVFEQADAKKLGVICFTVAAITLLVHPAPAWLNPVLVFAGGAITVAFPYDKSSAAAATDVGKKGVPVAVAVAIFCLYGFFVVFTIYVDTFDHGWIMPFLTAGMFVWGGGPVVLPMLMTYLTPAWISPTIFLAGISFAEMMPGPVFNISLFLGVQLALNNGWSWLKGMMICWAGLMGPGILLCFGAYTLWGQMRKFPFYQKALPGLNAAAVGLLVPTIFIAYDTLQDRSPFKAGSRTMAVVAYCAVEVLKLNVPLVVICAGLVGLLWSLVQTGVIGS
mmetsp:Transcript_27416/g.63334  ORF Transcript_27416/g.63334 Transcript_27416/m.63334 type:complete len:431 (+) Transcript_27416:75-1367(+)